VIAFFFFFFFSELYSDPIVKAAFDMVLGDKLTSDGYCDISEYIFARINKTDMLRDLEKIKSPISLLYKDAYPTSKTIIEVWINYKRNSVSEQSSINQTQDFQIQFIEAKAIMNWIYRSFNNKDERISATNELVKILGNVYANIDGTLGFVAQGVIYVKTKVEINIISSIAALHKEISAFETLGYSLFYRGHSDANYVLKPSVFRRDSWLKNERRIYNELIINCPQDFQKCKTHLDYLVEMQHYGLPTRLLDITRNPLVALYFACADNNNSLGELIVFKIDNNEIRYPQSDTVSILASLPLFDYDMQQKFKAYASDAKLSPGAFNEKIDRLLHEIKTEKPAFRDGIEKDDILKCVAVLSLKNNNRIIKQDGAFILCGLSDKTQYNINNLRYTYKKRKQIYLIKNKAKLKKQLDTYSINHATLFPEIDDVAKYIKEKY